MRYLFLILFLSCSPLKKYESFAKKWENDIKKLEILDQKENYSDQAILFIGSSSIRKWDSIKENLNPYKPIKRGYGGAHYYDLVHFTKRLVSPHKVKAIAIFVANDITGEKEGINDLSPKEVLNLAKFVVKQIRKTHKKTPIFFIETTPTSSRWKVWNKISKANGLIKDFTSKNKNMFYIDTRTFYIKSNGMPNDEFFIADKLHLNNKGYKLWGKIIKDSFDKNLILKN
ncbi:MAG: hypothetical protein HOG23_06405 [Flavobacteriaceae bacterium]|jgi:hypothetical protein|nr:hypothetical protein [Flavobacteriaceae bacterium]